MRTSKALQLRKKLIMRAFNDRSHVDDDTREGMLRSIVYYRSTGKNNKETNRPIYMIPFSHMDIVEANVKAMDTKEKEYEDKNRVEEGHSNGSKIYSGTEVDTEVARAASEFGDVSDNPKT